MGFKIRKSHGVKRSQAALISSHAYSENRAFSSFFHPDASATKNLYERGFGGIRFSHFVSQCTNPDPPEWNIIKLKR